MCDLRRAWLTLPLFLLPVLLRASGLALPFVNGRLSADVLPIIIPGAPALHTEFSFSRTAGTSQAVVIMLSGEGTHLRIELEVDPDTRRGSWKLTAGSLDLKSWNPALLPRLGITDPAFALTGQLSATGAGQLEDDDLTGSLVLSLRDGLVANDSEGWKLEGISAGGHFDFDTRSKEIRSSAPATVVVQTITSKRFGARNLTLSGKLQDNGSFALASARVEIAGGDVALAPTVIDLQPFHFFAEATINRVGLQDIAALVPATLRYATGRIDGTVQIGWSAASQVELGKGHLVLRKDEPAEVTLRPFPGLFTSGFPAWLLKLPERFVRSPLGALRRAELGQTPIEAQTMDLTFSPEPDAEGRTAVVNLTGIPKGEMGRTPVIIQANVYGSLKQFIQLGTQTDFNLAVH